MEENNKANFAEDEFHRFIDWPVRETIARTAAAQKAGFYNERDLQSGHDFLEPIFRLLKIFPGMTPTEILRDAGGVTASKEEGIFDTMIGVFDKYSHELNEGTAYVHFDYVWEYS